MAAKANIYVDQGSTYSTVINMTDSNGNVINLTGYSFTGQIKKFYTSSNVMNFAVAITSANTGDFTIGLDANTTSNMEYGRYVYDVNATDVSNTVTRIVEGILTINPGVTNISGNVNY